MEEGLHECQCYSHLTDRDYNYVLTSTNQRVRHDGRMSCLWPHLAFRMYGVITIVRCFSLPYVE